jgi:hypothetical protein
LEILIKLKLFEDVYILSKIQSLLRSLNTIICRACHFSPWASIFGCGVLRHVAVCGSAGMSMLIWVADACGLDSWFAVIMMQFASLHRLYVSTHC